MSRTSSAVCRLPPAVCRLPQAVLTRVQQLGVAGAMRSYLPAMPALPCEEVSSHTGAAAAPPPTLVAIVDPPRTGREPYESR